MVIVTIKMFNFLVFVFLELLFQSLNYFSSFIGDYFKDSSLWKDCPNDINFWHSVHGITASFNLVLVLIVLSRAPLRLVTPSFLLRVSVFTQIFSLYWLLLGSLWIYEDIVNGNDCVRTI